MHYIVFGGMAIWAISLVGIGPILTTFRAVFRKQKTVASCFWCDKRGGCGLGGTGGERIRLYQNAHSFREQALGQTLGLVVAIFCLRSPGYVLLPEPVFITG